MSVVTLLEAKAHLRVLESDDDAYIQNLIDVAQAQAEEITSRYMEETATVFYLTEAKGIFELPKSPLIAVDSIEYYSEFRPVRDTECSIFSSERQKRTCADKAKCRFQFKYRHFSSTQSELQSRVCNITRTTEAVDVDAHCNDV